MAKKEESKPKKPAGDKPKTAKKAEPKASAAKSTASHAKTTHAKADSHKPAAKSSHAPAKAATHAKSHKPHKAGSAGGIMSGGIDTNLAASAAASLLLARRKGRDRLSDNVSVNQIKSDLSKSHADVAGNVLDQHADATGAKRPDLPQSQQRGGSVSSQTVGQAASRMSVPRRTSG